jgi:hypothetical protein
VDDPVLVTLSADMAGRHAWAVTRGLGNIQSQVGKAEFARLLDLGRALDPQAPGRPKRPTSAPVAAPASSVVQAAAAPGELVAPAFLNPPPTAYDPRGFAVGVLANAALLRGGLRLQQFRWRYGFDYRAHPFPPHRALDGRFMPLDGTLDGFYPDDHKGCRCSVAPVYAREGRVLSQALLLSLTAE